MNENMKIGWLAGFYEGEGSIIYATRSITMSVASTDLDSIERFLEYAKMGTINGPYPNGSEKNKLIYYWRVSGVDKIEYLFSLMRPFLSERRISQIESVLDKWYSRLFVIWPVSERCDYVSPGDRPTSAGRHRHQRRNEPPCLYCKDLANTYERNRKRAKKYG